MTSTHIDEELMRCIEAEYAGAKGKDRVSESSLVTENKADTVAEPVTGPSTWPSTYLFSELFGSVPPGKRDIPVPKFNPDDWPEEARAMIPSLPDYWEHNIPTMYAIAVAVLCGDTTLLTGPTGTGKTSSLVAFNAVCGIPTWVTSCYGRMEHTEFVGSSSLRADEATGANITQYNPTQLINSIKYGGMAIIDEAFRSPTLMTIQSLLESKHSIVLAEADGLAEHERVLVGEPGRWWIMLTDNTCGTGDHTGSYNAEVQDLSTLDRITSTIYVDYNPPIVECKILRNAVPSLQEHVIKDMVSVGNLIRAAFKRGAVMQTVSMRALLSWADKTHKTGSLDYGFNRAYYAKLDPDSAAIAVEVWHQVFGRDLESA
jgi:MoxR-like ATPase